MPHDCVDIKALEREVVTRVAQEVSAAFARGVPMEVALRNAGAGHLAPAHRSLILELTNEVQDTAHTCDLVARPLIRRASRGGRVPAGGVCGVALPGVYS
jgi:hypothetical protein